MKSFAGFQDIPDSLDDVTRYLIPLSKSRSVKSVVSKLLFAASSYFIWQERNNRIFKHQRRSEVQVIDIIKSTVQLKLLTCKFKKTSNTRDLLRVLQLPLSLLHS